MARQSGQAALLLIVILVIGIPILVYSSVNPTAIPITNEKKNAAVLAQAKEALIGYAAAHPSKPGILPCPDMDNDGTADAPCGTNYATVVGRLPWKTLGLPDLRDASGECLWYAVSGNYKNSGPTGESGSTPINSDTLGTLAVNNSGGTLLHAASTVAAIVFAPGLSLSGQDRSTVGTTICRGNTTASNYLETYTVGATTFNNSTGNDFVVAPALVSLSGLNDQLLPITRDALFNVVNIRVAREAVAALEAYREDHSYYPFANDYGSASPFNCVTGLTKGRFPSTTTGAGSCGQAAWPARVSAFENWFKANEWSTVTHYAMSKVCGQFGFGSVTILFVSVNLDGLLIDACNSLGSIGGVVLGVLNFGLSLLGLPSFSDDPITVTGVSSNVRTLVIVTGRAQEAMQIHPCASIGQCVEDAANADGNSIYIKPSRFPISNDRMALTCATNSPCNVVP